MSFNLKYMPFRNSKEWAIKQIEDCKNVPEVNSRMMFLATSIAIILCMFILTIGLFYSDRIKEVYEGGMGVLLGGHGVAAYARSKNKGDAQANGNGNGNGNGGSDDSDSSDPAPAPQQVAPAAPAPQPAPPAPGVGSAGEKG